MRKCRRASNLRDEQVKEKRRKTANKGTRVVDRTESTSPVHRGGTPLTSGAKRSEAVAQIQTATTLLMKQNCNQRTLFLLKESSFREVDVTGSVVCTTKNKTLFVSRGRFELNYSPKKKFEGPAKRSLISRVLRPRSPTTSLFSIDP